MLSYTFLSNHARGLFFSNISILASIHFLPSQSRVMMAAGKSGLSRHPFPHQQPLAPPGGFVAFPDHGSGSFLGSPTSWMCTEYFLSKVSPKDIGQSSWTTSAGSFWHKKQFLFSEVPLDIQILYSHCKAKTRHLQYKRVPAYNNDHLLLLFWSLCSSVQHTCFTADSAFIHLLIACSVLTLHHK